MAYASGKWANAICDICGRSCQYAQLRDYIFNQVPNGLRVCPECFDVDNPQLQVGRLNQQPEAIALWRPRPDTGIPQCRGWFGWLPVISLTAQCTLNAKGVTVTTS